MISKGSRSVMNICHIMIGATFLLLSTSQFDVAEGKAFPDDNNDNDNDSQTAFELEQCGIPTLLFYQPSSQIPTGKSPFDSVCSSNTQLGMIDKAVCKLFKLLALNACSKFGNPQAVAARYYNDFSQERSTLEQVCIDFNNISLSAKSKSPALDGYELLHQAGTMSTLYFLAGKPSEKSICNLFCSMTASHLMMCKGLDFLLMTYINAYQPKDGLHVEGGPSVSDESNTRSSLESGSKQNDSASKEGTSSDKQEPTASVTDHHEPGSKQSDTASKEDTSPVDQELQDVANDQETGYQQSDPASKEDTSPINQGLQEGAANDQETGYQQNDTASKEDTSPIDQGFQEGVAYDQETGYQQSDAASKEDALTVTEDEHSSSSVSDFSEEELSIFELGSKPDAGQDELDPYKQMDETDMQTDEEEELEGGKEEVYQEHVNTLLRVPEISSIDFDEEESSSHFMAYSLIAIIIIMATYIMYHNKQRIIAVIIEGRNANERRRRNNDGYQKLDQNLSDVMPSLQKSKEYKF